MNKKITAISEVFDEDDNSEGYSISLSDNSLIRILIEAETQCCEYHGYMCSEDEFADFIGAEIISVESISEDLVSSEIISFIDGLRDIDNERYTCDVFVNVNTNRGALQFALYNSHNGYYGHNYIVKYDDDVIDEGIL